MDADGPETSRLSRGRPSPTAWRSVVQAVPGGLSLVSKRSIASQVVELLGNAASRHRYDQASACVSAAVSQAPVQVDFRPRHSVSGLRRVATLSNEQRVALGESALGVYFAQLFAGDVAFLDLGVSAFARDGQATVWVPRPLYVWWDRRFLDSVRKVYQGFFGRRVALFDSGLAELDLDVAAPLIRRHLGAALERPTRFESTDLGQTLRALVERRRHKTRSLHRNFVAFGLLLVSLHTLLARLDRPVDVGKVFNRVVA